MRSCQDFPAAVLGAVSTIRALRLIFVHQTVHHSR